jgi:hypothetical protein
LRKKKEPDPGNAGEGIELKIKNTRIPCPLVYDKNDKK